MISENLENNLERNKLTSCTAELPLCIVYLEYAIDKLFISSFILNKIKDFPLGSISTVLGNIALCCIAVAYTLQLITTNYYQIDETENQNLLNYQTRAQLIAFIGTIITWFCIFHSALWLPCFWFMCINNLFWLYNESSRTSKPSLYPKTPNDQEEYCHYVGWMTLAMLSSAIANTLGIFAIAQQHTLIIIGRIFNWCFSLLGVRSLYNSNNPKDNSLEINHAI